jgi:hypothetical protein
MKPKNKHERLVAKLLRNSITGRAGMDPFKYRNKLVNQKNLIEILKIYNVIDHIKIGEDLHLVSYNNILDRTVCEESVLDYIEVLNPNSVLHKESDKESKGFSSIYTAAVVLSYAIIHMMKAMIYVLNNGGNIYYTDTDSLVIDIKLPETMVDSQKLGYFKLEHEIEEGYFFLRNEKKLML